MFVTSLLPKQFWLRDRSPRWLYAGVLGVLLWIGGSWVLTRPTIAAEQVVITYGPLQASLTVKELETFVEKQEVSKTLHYYLDLAKMEPDLLRDTLTTELQISQTFLERLLQSTAGTQFLEQISPIIGTPSQPANLSDLRSAFLRSVKGDDRVSVLELLKNYPTKALPVDGAIFLKLVRALQAS